MTFLSPLKFGSERLIPKVEGPDTSSRILMNQVTEVVQRVYSIVYQSLQ